MGARTALPVAIALAAAGLAHLGSLGNGFTNWDDPGYLLHNRLTASPLADGIDGLLLTRSLAYPVPVTVLAYAGQRAIFDLSPAPYHLVSLALHLLCVALAERLARRLGAGPWAAAGAALLFGVHPIAVEPVAWVVGQKDLLAAAFVLAALLVRAGPAGHRPGPSTAVFGLVLLAIGAKPSAVAAIAILPALDLALGRTPDRIAVRLYVAAGAAATLSIAAGLVGHGFVGGEAPASFGLRSLAEALWAVSLHARHLVWPDPLLARYFSPTGTGLAGFAVAGGLLVAALAAGAALAWRRGRREVAFSIAAALFAYAPVSGLIPLSRGAADSYVYLPLALAVVAGARGLERLAGRSRPAAVAGVVAAALGLGLVAARQTSTWKDAARLWTPVAAEYPADPRALMRAGDAHLSMGRPDAALVWYDAVRRRFPDFATSLPAHAAALEALGRPTEAESLLALAVRLGGADALESYGFFLAAHDVRPSDAASARAALVAVGELLATRGKKPATVARAARLLRELGEAELAAALERRLAELHSR